MLQFDGTERVFVQFVRMRVRVARWRRTSDLDELLCGALEFLLGHLHRLLNLASQQFRVDVLRQPLLLQKLKQQHKCTRLSKNFRNNPNMYCSGIVAVHKLI